jgi:hypothetical protein
MPNTTVLLQDELPLCDEAMEVDRATDKLCRGMTYLVYFYLDFYDGAKFYFLE